MQSGSPDRVDRRLAAVLAADVVGYSRLMEADEAGTARLLREHRAAVDPLVAEHGGRIVKTTGDGVLVEFPSVVDAVECAVALQKLMTDRNAGVPTERRMEWRVGIHLGDIIIEGDDILGDGVNLAARLEGIAEPGGICISEDAFRQVRGKIETEFLDGGEQALKNIARPVRVYRAHPASAPIQPVPAATDLALPDKPSIAVLPFQNMSGDPEQEYFADGMVEEIITALSKVRSLFVIARNSTFTYKGQAVDVKQAGRDLGVRYVLEGSVRRASGRVRITAQLIDAMSGTHLWADRFDGFFEDVFELQDEVASRVAGVIEPALQIAESRRSRQPLTKDMTAYDLYLRALPNFYSMSQDGFLQALNLFEQAIARDPSYGLPLAYAAICRSFLARDGWSEDPERDRHEFINLARRALQFGDSDPDILASAALVLSRLGEDIGAMIGMIDRALALNPNFARGWNLSGILRLFAGEHDLAIEHIKTSLRLSPRGRIGIGTPLVVTLGAAYFFKRQFNEAATQLRLSIQEHPGFPTAYWFLAACLAHMGRLEEARAIIARLRAITPQVVPDDLPWRKPEDRELLLSGLRLAMGETT